MSETIRFFGFLRTKTGFSCFVLSDKKKRLHRLKYALDPCPGIPDNDSVACALSVLCGRGYKKVRLAIPVTEACRRELEELTGAKWICPAAPAERPAVGRKRGLWVDHWYTGDSRPGERRILINFSGGIDSLAALALLPRERVDLVSVDFGGYFMREAFFFRDFHPYILHTNLRQLHYDGESWKYMGSGSLLFSRLICGDAAYQVFGSNFENSPLNLRDDPPFPALDPPFCMVGIEGLPIIQSISEIGTTIVVTHYFPELINAALTSLAPNPSAKRYRKQLLMEIVSERFHRELSLEPCDFPLESQRTRFGQDNSLDYLTVYLLKHRGREAVERSVTGLPEELFDLVEKLDMTFYERYSTKHLARVPEELREDYVRRMEAAGVLPWDEHDMEEFKQVRAVLSRYCPTLLD